jgi:ParB family transcriptional regulator, chromosome partitioning protein
VQAGLRDNRITMGHAKALMAISNPLSLLSAYKEVVSKGMSVRQVEQLVRNLESKPTKGGSSSPSNKSHEMPLTVRKMQDQLTSSLSTKVLIDRMKDGKGNIIIKFYNDDDLERLVDAISEK